jgi:L-asparaginase
MPTRADKPRILIIGHGGTIGMTPGKDGALRPAKTVDELIGAIPGVKEHASFDLLQLTTKDSTNVNPSDWVRLAYTIADAAKSGKFDGILVTHGTDTLANTATAIAYFFGPNIPLPVVFTGSQKTLIEFGTDAAINVQESILTLVEAQKLGIKESMITFGHYVFRGARTMKRSEAEFDAFYSPTIAPLAHIDALGVHFTNVARSHRTPNPKWQDEFRPFFARNVFTISVEPGLEPGLMESVIDSGKCSGILIRSLGAGNVPTEGEYSLLPIIGKAVHERKIPVLISTKFPAGTAHPEIYETGVAALEAGAIGTGDLTEVAAHAKLIWALGQGVTNHRKLQTVMQSDYVGDVTSLHRLRNQNLPAIETGGLTIGAV